MKDEAKNARPRNLCGGGCANVLKFLNTSAVRSCRARNFEQQQTGHERKSEESENLLLQWFVLAWEFIMIDT